MKEDKIFNNRYNTGDLEFEQFGKIEVNDIHRPKDFFEEYIENQLQKDLYQIFISSEFYDEYNKSKKVPRSEVAQIYYYFDERLKETEAITAIERFINIAEFMSISYDVLYDELSPAYKEKLLKELDLKYGIFKKRKIYRLF
ncbi:MAG: hypothetical protein RLZZ479_397 [Bacteroidota bacterium]|jgi:hypothetical protein